MIYIYDSCYLEHAVKKIGDMYSWAVRYLGFDIDEFQRYFQQSGIATQVAQGNPHYILELFGHELAEEVLWKLGWESIPEPKIDRFPEDSPETWAGGMATRLQHRLHVSFEDLHSLLPMSELVSLFPNYMGYDPSIPVADMERLLRRRGLRRTPSWLEWCKAFGFTVPPEEDEDMQEKTGPAKPSPAEA